MLNDPVAATDYTNQAPQSVLNGQIGQTGKVFPRPVLTTGDTGENLLTVLGTF